MKHRHTSVPRWRHGARHIAGECYRCRGVCKCGFMRDEIVKGHNLQKSKLIDSGYWLWDEDVSAIVRRREGVRRRSDGACKDCPAQETCAGGRMIVRRYQGLILKDGVGYGHPKHLYIYMPSGKADLHDVHPTAKAAHIVENRKCPDPMVLKGWGGVDYHPDADMPWECECGERPGWQFLCLDCKTRRPQR